MADARSLGSSDLVVVLVGNKLDREEEREVGYVEASRWAGENGECRCLLLQEHHISHVISFVLFPSAIQTSYF